MTSFFFCRKTKHFIIESYVTVRGVEDKLHIESVLSGVDGLLSIGVEQSIEPKGSPSASGTLVIGCLAI